MRIQFNAIALSLRAKKEGTPNWMRFEVNDSTMIHSELRQTETDSTHGILSILHSYSEASGCKIKHTLLQGSYLLALQRVAINLQWDKWKITLLYMALFSIYHRADNLNRFSMPSQERFKQSYFYTIFVKRTKASQRTVDQWIPFHVFQTLNSLRFLLCKWWFKSDSIHSVCAQLLDSIFVERFNSTQK